MDSAPVVDFDSVRPANVAFEVQSGVNASSSASTKSTTRERRRRGTSESSTSRIPAKTYAELIKHKSVGKSAAILINRTNNRTKTVRNFLLESLRAKEQIITPSPLGAKLQKFNEDLDDTEAEILRTKQDIRDIPVYYKKGILTEAEAKQRLIEIEDRKSKKILQDLQVARERLDQIKREKEKTYEKTCQLEPMFLDDGDDIQETLNEEILPQVTAELSLEEQLRLTESVLQDKIARLEDENKAFKRLTESKEATLQTAASMVEDLQNKNQELMKQIGMYEAQLSSCPRTVTDVGFTFEQDEDLQSKFSDLKHQLYEVNNNQVENHDFPGLEEALDKTTGRKVPDYLELIATRITEDRGKATGSAHFSVLVLVCAAVKEMEDSVEVSDWKKLKKWAAALNQAGDLGFQVGFANKLLNTKLLAYFATTELLEGIQQNLDSES